MNKANIKTISNFFKNISDPTRLNILLLLQNNSLCVGKITELMHMEQSAISHQLIYLKKYKFVKSIKIGKEMRYTLACHHINDLINIALEHMNKHGCK